jgi:hypothetical protein
MNRDRDAHRYAPPHKTRAAFPPTIALVIDGGHMRAARQYQGRSFEVLVAQVSNNAGNRVVSASVPTEADLQSQQSHGVLLIVLR